MYCNKETVQAWWWERKNEKNLFPQKEWCQTKLLTRVTVSTYYFPTDDDEEGPKFKDKLLAAILRCIDIFCVWDCCWLWLEFQKYVSLLVFDPFVELFITLCIVVNTLFMALDHHDMDKDMERVLKTGNYVSDTNSYTVAISIRYRPPSSVNVSSSSYEEFSIANFYILTLVFWEYIFIW